MNKLIIIDNTIAAGKTTLINKLIERNPSWYRIPESCSLPDANVFPMSDEYYADYTQSKIASCFAEAQKHPVVICDRIFSSPKYWAAYEGKEASDYTNQLIERIKEMLINTKIYYFYLNDPTPNKSILLGNIKKRGRDFEQHYTTKKLIQLEKIYKCSVTELTGLTYDYYTINLSDLFYRAGHFWIERIVKLSDNCTIKGNSIVN